MKTRIDIINYLINKYNYKTYLEIGVQNGISFRAIELPIEKKVGVDPDLLSKATIHLTSDEFFKENRKTFDIIFIDGLHETDQVDKDIRNALNSLNKEGIIVLHDCNPIKEEHQVVPRISKHWNGDVWKSLVKARYIKFKDITDTNSWEKSELFIDSVKIRTVDIDEGIGLISAMDFNTIDSNVINAELMISSQDLELTYENLEKNRKHWLNLISVEEFKQQY